MATGKTGRRSGRGNWGWGNLFRLSRPLSPRPVENLSTRPPTSGSRKPLLLGAHFVSVKIKWERNEWYIEYVLAKMCDGWWRRGKGGREAIHCCFFFVENTECSTRYPYSRTARCPHPARVFCCSPPLPPPPSYRDDFLSPSLLTNITATFGRCVLDRSTNLDDNNTKKNKIIMDSHCYTRTSASPPTSKSGARSPFCGAPRPTSGTTPRFG